MASEHVYRATIRWEHDGRPFTRGRYKRTHTWSFDGGIEVAASASPQVVPLPFSSEAAIDPEEALVAALSSCHMMTFLWLVSKAGLTALSYRDDAAGFLEKDEQGRMWVSRVVLQPVIDWEDAAPDPERLAGLHHEAHQECYIANSVKTQIEIRS